MFSVIVAFVTYWLILFVACYIVTEYAQKYLYDEATPRLGLKLALGTTILAALATYFRPTYDTMFTTDIAWTILQAIAWFLVFLFILSFHPPHALGLGLAMMVLVAGMASLAVDSLRGDAPNAARRQIRAPSKPLRRPAASAPTTPPTQSRPDVVPPSP